MTRNIYVTLIIAHVTCSMYCISASIWIPECLANKCKSDIMISASFTPVCKAPGIKRPTDFNSCSFSGCNSQSLGLACLMKMASSYWHCNTDLPRGFPTALQVICGFKVRRQVGEISPAPSCRLVFKWWIWTKQREDFSTMTSIFSTQI